MLIAATLLKCLSFALVEALRHLLSRSIVLISLERDVAEDEADVLAVKQTIVVEVVPIQEISGLNLARETTYILKVMRIFSSKVLR